MKITHEKMMGITKSMPMKQIDIDGEPYLQRYYAGTFLDGKDLWFHRFLRNDSERHLHSHGFNFTTVMLLGGYTEEFLNKSGDKDFRVSLPSTDELSYNPNIENYCSFDFIYTIQKRKRITVFDWHRIAAVEPDTWTMMIVDGDRLPFWYFRDDDYNLTPVASSKRDWWKDYQPRT